MLINVNEQGWINIDRKLLKHIIAKKNSKNFDTYYYSLANTNNFINILMHDFVGDWF